jgi:hypothetical protein
MSLSSDDYVSVPLTVEEPLLLPEPKPIFSLQDSLATQMTPAQLHPFVDDAARCKHSAGAYSLFLRSATHIVLLEGIPGYQSSKRGLDGMPFIEIFAENPDGQLLQLTVSNEVATFGAIPSLTGSSSPQDVLKFITDFALNPYSFLDLQTSSAQSLQSYSRRTVIVHMPRDFHPNPPQVCLTQPRPQDPSPQVIDLTTTTTTDSLPSTVPALAPFGGLQGPSSVTSPWDPPRRGSIFPAASGPLATTRELFSTAHMVTLISWCPSHG